MLGYPLLIEHPTVESAIKKAMECTTRNGPRMAHKPTIGGREGKDMVKQKAVVYVRVSTNEQSINGVSLDAQISKLEAYAKLQDLEIVKVLREEGVSGSTHIAKRPMGKELTRMIQNKEVIHVLAVKLDRLFRNALDSLQTLEAWDKAGVSMHLVENGGMNTSTPMGRMFFQMLGIMAECERNMIADRIKTCMQHKKTTGLVYTNQVFGYDKSNGKLIPNEDEQNIINLIKHLRTQGLSMNKIATHLNSNGYTTKNGKKWYSQQVKNVLDLQMVQQ